MASTIEDAAADGTPTDDVSDAATEADAPHPHSEFCGDGIRDPITEECDDGNADELDSCTSACQVRDLLAALPDPPSDAGAPRPAGRSLGNGRHPAAAARRGFAVAFIDLDPDATAVSLSLFSDKGVPEERERIVSDGTQPLLFADPVVAALPGGSFAVAWTDFDGDGDELGVALRRVTPEGNPVGSIRYANGTRAFSQYDADMIWTGSQLVVAWADDSNGSTGPDLRYRTFSETLAPLGSEQTLAATSAIEGNVALARVTGGWAAAWRHGHLDGTETVKVRLDATEWHLDPPYFPAPATDKPAIAELDADRLLLVYTEGTDPLVTGLHQTPRLRGAVLDRAAPGPAASFPIDPLVEPYDTDDTLAQSHPNAVRVGSRVYVAWRADRVLGDSRGDELWLKEIRWSDAAFQDGGTELVVDLSETEIRLPRWPEHREGDQRLPALAASPLFPEGALVTAWDDLGQTLADGQRAPDVVVELIPSPIVRLDLPPVGE